MNTPQRSSHLFVLVACVATLLTLPPLSTSEANGPARTFKIPARTKARMPALGFRAKRITIDIRAADIHNVLRLLSKQGGVNIIAGPEVSGKVTANLEGVLVRDAFWGVVRSHGLRVERAGSVIVVTKP